MKLTQLSTTIRHYGCRIPALVAVLFALLDSPSVEAVPKGHDSISKKKPHPPAPPQPPEPPKPKFPQ